MTPHLIGLAGRAKSGKNTVADMLAPLLPLPYTQRAFADPLKDMVAEWTGCDRLKLNDQAFKATVAWSDRFGKPQTYRQILQEWGNAEREKDPDYWVNKLFAHYSPESRWIVTDVRYPNEKAAIEALGGVVIRINRPLPWWLRLWNWLLRRRLDQHTSETALDHAPFTYTITNDGDLVALQGKVRRLVEGWG